MVDWTRVLKISYLFASRNSLEVLSEEFIPYITVMVDWTRVLKISYLFAARSSLEVLSEECREQSIKRM